MASPPTTNKTSSFTFRTTHDIGEHLIKEFLFTRCGHAAYRELREGGVLAGF